VIELPDDFRDLLVELCDAGAEFVVLGGHAVAFHGHPRATKDLDVLVRPETVNAERVYQALAAFGAPLEAFEVHAADFATYDGVLQIGLPPRRIDILNRADGITFDEAIEDGQSFVAIRDGPRYFDSSKNELPNFDPPGDADCDLRRGLSFAFCYGSRHASVFRWVSLRACSVSSERGLAGGHDLQLFDVHEEGLCALDRRTSAVRAAVRAG
jgi:hypothetical protein